MIVRFHRGLMVLVLLGLTQGPLRHARSQSNADAAATLFSVEATAADPPLRASQATAIDAATGAEAKPPQSPTQPQPDKKPAAPPQPYKGSFFDNDFSYLRYDPSQVRYLGDRLKLLEQGPCQRFEFGGEYRARYHHEHNLRGTNLSGRDDDFLLHRTRLYGNYRYSDWFRAYGEAVDANSEFENFAPRTIEENRFDALNLFAEVRLGQLGDGALWGRVGRQEMAFGAERLISPLDWSNTRRTFDGAKLYWKSQDWNVDAFWTRPVPFDQHVDSDSNFDHPDQSQEFHGVYASYRGKKQQTWDLFYLRLAEYDAPGTPANPANFDVNTLGARWYAQWGPWLAEIEGGYQFGEFDIQDHSAGYAVVGGGHQWNDWRSKPVLWVYYDWASGDADPLDGKHNTFNQLFPLVHKYFGFMDLVARQNIQDLNFQLTLEPREKRKLLIWWHIFHLDEARDALYNAPGVPIRRDPNGNSGTDVGQELDLLYTMQLSPRRELWFGYSHFWPGDFITRAPNNPPGVDGEADFFYTQFSWKF